MAKLTREQIVEASRKGAELAAQPSIRIRPHAGVDPECGSFEVIHPAGSTYFYWDDDKTRRGMSFSNRTTRDEAIEAARTFARKEREKLG